MNRLNMPDLTAEYVHKTLLRSYLTAGVNEKWDWRERVNAFVAKAFARPVTREQVLAALCSVRSREEVGPMGIYGRLPLYDAESVEAQDLADAVMALIKESAK